MSDTNDMSERNAKVAGIMKRWEEGSITLIEMTTAIQLLITTEEWKEYYETIGEKPPEQALFRKYDCGCMGILYKVEGTKETAMILERCDEDSRYSRVTAYGFSSREFDCDPEHLGKTLTKLPRWLTKAEAEEVLGKLRKQLFAGIRWMELKELLGIEDKH